MKRILVASIFMSLVVGLLPKNLSYARVGFGLSGAIEKRVEELDKKVEEKKPKEVTPSLTLTSPNGGEVWVVGTDRNISWTSTGAIANVKLEYSKDNFVNATTIIASTPNDGTHSWTIPNDPSITVKVRVSDAAVPGVNDVSNANFQIQAGLSSLFGSVLKTDGSNDYAKYATEGTVDINSSFTIEFWVYPKSTGCIISDDAYDVGYVIVGGNSCIAATIWFSSTSSGVTSVETYNYENLLNGWHHVTYIFDWSNNKVGIGIDGAITWYNLDFTVYGLSNITWPLTVGSYDSSSGFINADIEEVRISKIVRYSGSSYTVPTSPFTKDPDTLALWHFDESAGSTSFADSSDTGATLQGINGAVTGSP